MKKAILLLLLTTAFSVKSHSAVFTSIATGNYHAASTWSFTGSDADGIPDLDDNVTITSGKTVTLTGTENCKTLTINPGGIINLNLNTMRVYGDFTNNGTSTGSGSWQFRAAGTYSGNNLPNNGTVYFYAPYSIAAGVVMSKPGYMVVSASVILSNFGNVTLTAGSIQLLSGAKWINKSGSTVSVSTNVISSGTIDASAASNNFIYTGGGTTTVQATNATYYNLILSSGAGANTKALNGNLTVLNNLNINSNATLNWNNKNITLGGNWVNNANTACTNMATITFNGSGTQTITRSSQEFFNNVTLSGSGTVSIATNVRADGTTTLSSGTLDPGAFFYKQAGISWLNNGGAINTAATGSVLFNATVNQTIGGTTSTTFGNFGINNSGGSVILALNQTVTGVTTLLSGILDVSSFSFNQSGSTFSFSGGTLNTAATGKVVFTGSSAQTITSAATPSFGNVEINSSSTVTPATDVIVLGTTTMTSGTLDPSTFTWHQQGTSWVGNGGSVNAAASGEVVFDGAVNQTIGGSTGTTFGNLEFNNAGHSITLSVNSGGAATTLLTAGTFDVSTFSFSQSGDTWSATGGTLNTGASGKVIFTGAGTQSITAPSTFAFGNLEINAGGTVQLQIDITVAGTFTLTAGIFDVTTPANYGVKLLGDVVSNGATFQPRTGTVTLAGAGTQTISGSSQFQVYDLLDINSISISVTGLVSISDILTVSAGSFKTNGSGTVVLTATGPTTYARIAPLGAGAILAGTGWIVQSYIDGPATAYWQYLSTPIKNNQLSDWDNDTRFYMSGVGGNDGNACCPIFYSVRTYNTGPGTYSNVTSVSTTLTTGKGYMVWMADNLNQLTGPLIYDSRGTPNFGNKSIAVSSAGTAYNLVGNPYACPIDFSSVRTASGNLSANFFVLQENGSYATNPNGGVIAPNQGFMCIATSSGNMNFTESCKNTASLPNIIRQADPENFLRIVAGNDVNGLGGETVINFRDDATNGYDVDYDAPYLASPYEDASNLWTTDKDGKNLLLNSLDFAADEVDIPLTVQANATGTQTLSFRGLNRITAYSCAWLEDVATGEKISLNGTDYYSFKANMGDTKKFILHFDRSGDCNFAIPALGASLDASSQVFVNNGQLSAQFSFQEETNVQISVYDMMGRQISSSEKMTVTNNTVQLQNPDSHGIYLVRITKDNGEVVTKKIYY